MMMRARHAALLLLALFAPLAARAQLLWQEGKHYTLIAPQISTGMAPAGKIEVTEVFSYGCPFCFQAMSDMARLKNSLPVDTVMTFVPAAWNPSEAWPMFQRAYLTALSLGIAAANHEKLFTAIWETRQFPLLDIQTGRVRATLPTIEDAAAFYEKNSDITATDFLAKARSPEVEAQMHAADEYIKAAKVGGTPTLIVNGRYLVNSEAAGSWEKIRQVVDFLIIQERTRLKLPMPKGK